MKLTVIEPHQIIDATHQLSLLEIRLIQLTLTKTFMNESMVENRNYRIDLDELAEEFMIPRDTAYREVKSVIDTLATRTIVLNKSLVVPGASSKDKRIIHWVRHIDYNPTESYVEIQWHEDLVYILNTLGKDNPYSKYLLDNTKGMKSVLSIRLFRLLNKWRRTGTKSFEIEELKRLLGIEVGKYSNVVSFRRDVIDKAVRDINAKSSLYVESIPVRAGRCIVEFKFVIKDGGGRRKQKDMYGCVLE